MYYQPWPKIYRDVRMAAQGFDPKYPKDWKIWMECGHSEARPGVNNCWTKKPPKRVRCFFCESKQRRAERSAQYF